MDRFNGVGILFFFLAELVPLIEILFKWIYSATSNST
jgi:hypothetical protein